MSEAFRMNRIFQFAYPIVVLFTVLFAWNSVGQVHETAHGIAAPRSSGFDAIDLKLNPEDAQKICSVSKPKNFFDFSCTQEQPIVDKVGASYGLIQSSQPGILGSEKVFN